jgi:hypothetical protein
MLCTRCGEILKPVVAIDIDGTLGDYHGHFLRFAAEWTGRGLDALLNGSVHMYSGVFPFRVYCENLFNIDSATYRQIKLAYRQGGMKRSMPILQGARALCWAVKDAGAELWITTTRPYLSLDNIVPDTVEWLSRHEIEYDHMLFDADKYRVLADRVDSRRVVAVLDDLPEMYDAAAAILHYGHDVPVLVQGKFNYQVRRPMMATLDACADIVLARIGWWKEQNA